MNESIRNTENESIIILLNVVEREKMWYNWSSASLELSDFC